MKKRDFPKSLTALCSLFLFMACDAQEDSIEVPKIDEVSAEELATCIASSRSKVKTDRIEVEKVCSMKDPDVLTVKLFESNEPGCRPWVMAVAPKKDRRRAVRLLTSHGDGKTYYSSISLRQRALPDRRSGWVFYGAIDGYPKESCNSLDLKIDKVLCKSGQSFAAEYRPCDDVKIVLPSFFKSVVPLP